MAVNPWWFAAFACAAVWLLSSPPGGARLHLLLGATLFSSFAVLLRNKFGYYSVYATPIMDLAIAAFAVDLAQGRRRSIVPNPLAATIVGICLAIGLAVSLSVIRVNGSRDFNAVVGRLSPLIARDDVLIGSQTYWFALRDRRYYSWEQLVYHKRYYPDATVEDAFRAFKPDVLILDGHMEQFVQDHSEGIAYLGHLSVPRKELFAFLDQHAELVDDFDGAAFGQIRVYRIRWGSAERELSDRVRLQNAEHAAVKETLLPFSAVRSTGLHCPCRARRAIRIPGQS